MAWNLESMVLFRLAQGVFGAPLVPLEPGASCSTPSRARQHGQALAIFGLGIMVAPVIGPALGGYLTETYSWRMVFYINMPIGIFALLMAMRLSAEAADQGHQDRLGRHGTAVLAVGALQYRARSGPDARLVQLPRHRRRHHHRRVRHRRVLPRGWNKPDNIIDLSLLKDRNFVAGTLAITAYGISLFGWMAIMPLFSQRLLGYPADVAGTLFIPRAIVSAITLAITGSILIRLFDARYLVTAGLVMTALGTLPMAYFSLYVDFWGIATPGMIWRASAPGLFFVPLTAVAFASIPNAKYDEASGVYALMRGIGGSAGIAVVSWLFVRQAQIHFNELTAHITPFNRDLVPYLDAAWAHAAIARGGTR